MFLKFRMILGIFFQSQIQFGLNLVTKIEFYVEFKLKFLNQHTKNTIHF